MSFVVGPLNEHVRAAATNDKELKGAARLVIDDLERVTEWLQRALEDNTKRHLTVAHLQMPQWLQHKGTFARLLPRSQREDWELLVLSVEIDRFLESKRVNKLGTGSPMDIRERGWVWIAAFLNANARAQLAYMAHSSRWARLLGLDLTAPLLSALAHPPPLPTDLREEVGRHAIELDSSASGWGVETMRLWVRHAAVFQQPPEFHEQLRADLNHIEGR